MTQILPASAMLANLLEQPGPMPIEALHTSLVREYSLTSSFTVAKAQELAKQLEKEGIVTVSADVVTVDTLTRDRLMGLVNQKRTDLRRLVMHITDLAVEEGAAQADRAQLERSIEHFLAELFRRHGVDVADSVLANRPVVQDLAGAVKRSAETLSPNNRRTQVAMQRSVLRVFRDPSSDDAKAIYWLCQTYFLMGAYAIDPDGSVLSKSLFSGVRLWLDSNVILPVLADYHPLQVSYSRLLDGSVTQGSHLLVLTNLLDEVFGNAERAWSVVTELDSDPIAIDIYVESLGWERANVFLVGFTRARRAGRHETWEEYAKETGLPEPKWHRCLPCADSGAGGTKAKSKHSAPLFK